MFNKSIFFLASALIALSGCSKDSDPIPTNQVKKLRSDTRGHEVPEEVMISQGYKPFWRQHVVVDYPRNPHKFLPAKLVALDQKKSCTLKPPRPHESVHHVDIKGSSKQTKIYSWSRDDLKEESKKFAKTYKDHGKESAEKNIRLGNTLSLVNVYVTDKSAPNHLMLSSYDDVLWNIQTAEGVKITSITLIGHGISAIANVSGNVKIQNMAGEKAKRCNVQFSRKPDKTWRLVQYAEKEPGNYSEYVDKAKHQYGMYNRWYLKNFGESAGDKSIKSQSVSNILLGPIPDDPEKRLKYKSIEGQTVYLVGERSAIIGAGSQTKEYLRNTVIEKVKSSIGGDLSVLRPGS